MASGQQTRVVSSKAAERGEPSYVWREGQARRLGMLLRWAEGRERGLVLENGCGVGEYLARLGQTARLAVGMDVEFPRLLEAKSKGLPLVCAAGEALPFKRGSFDLVLSNEVIEHVRDDRQAVTEMINVLKAGGRLVLFCPNRGYLFETHGIYVRGQYRFGNKFLVNYLPDRWRNRLAPHVRAYTSTGLGHLFNGLPAAFIFRTVIFGAYDNIIARAPAIGKLLRALLQGLERSPLRVLGLSHFWVVEKTSG